MARDVIERQRNESSMSVVPRVIVAMLLVFGGFIGVLRATSAQVDSDGVRFLRGTVVIENPNELATGNQPAMLLLDMTAFIDRDPLYQPALESQVLAPLLGDRAIGAEFRMGLPIEPQGETHTFGDETGAVGVQVFSLEYYSNRQGDAFIGPFEGGGWGTAYTSLDVRAGDFEVVGGSIMVWAPDDAQLFPTGFGDDGLLFTGDEPVDAIPAGWTVVDLNSEPFDLIREPDVEVEIVTGDDYFTELSGLGYAEAFVALVEELRLIYAFTEFRGIDFDALEAEYLPLIEEAEGAGDFDAYQRAIYEFSLEFNDGHVGAFPPQSFIAENIGGRLGMRVNETDDGDFIVVSVTEGLPADEAGIEVGAEVQAWNGGSVEDGLAAEPLIISESSPHRLRQQQFEFLARGPLGETVTVTFQNPDALDAETVELTFSQDIDGRDVAANTAVSVTIDDAEALPVQARLLDSGVGYIRINTFFVDPVLFTSAWDYAISSLQGFGATGLIIDVRSNGGGYGDLPLYAAGSFYEEEFELAETFFPDREGGFVSLFSDVVIPNDVPWEGGPVAVLTDINCASACEIFTGAMADNPEHLIISFFPTAGIEAGVYLWALPDGLLFQASFVFFEREGEIYIEGEGVPPTVQIPATRETLILSDRDVELDFAEDIMLFALAGELESPDAEAEGDLEVTPVSEPDVDATPAA